MAQTSTDPLVLAAAANCFMQCIPIGEQLAVQTYLLAVIAGLDTSQAGVQTLINNARCFMQCIPPGDQLAVQNFILAQLAS
jgi:hypothetical protein